MIKKIILTWILTSNLTSLMRSTKSVALDSGIKLILIPAFVLGLIIILVLNFYSKNNNWRTYENSSIGYSIKYPANWHVKEYKKFCPYKDCLENLYIENMRRPVIVAGHGPYTENGSSFNIVIIRGFIPLGKASDIQEMNIGGIKMEVWKGHGTVRGEKWSTGINFVHEDKFYKFNYFSGTPEQYEKDLDTFEQILASFTLK